MPFERRGAVNWQDGMLIESAHLTAETEFLRSLSSRASQVALGTFGLHAGPGEAMPIDLQVVVAGGECAAELRRFRGFFPDGTWVEFEADGQSVILGRAPVDGNASHSFAVYIQAHDDNFMGMGEPDPADDPPRQPYRIPRLELCMGDDPGWPRGRSMRLATVRVEGGVATLDPSHIPPSVTMATWPTLRDLAERFAEYLERWRRLALGNFITLLPIATAPAGGLGREIAYAKRETAYQLAVEIARLQSSLALRSRRGAPVEWFELMQTGARLITTLLELNRDLAGAMQDGGGFSAAMGTLRDVADYEVTSEDLRRMAAITEEGIQAVEILLNGLFEAREGEKDVLRYRDKEYAFTPYAKRVYKREADREYMEIQGISAAEVEDYVVLLKGAVGAAVRKSPPNTHIGVNDRKTWPQADPAFVDHTFMEGAALFHPHGFLPQREVNSVTMICIGGGDLSSFEQGDDQDVRVFIRKKASA